MFETSLVSSADWTARARAVQSAEGALHQAAAKMLLAAAVKLSSGPGALKGAYRAFGGVAGFNPAIINRVTGLFAASWISRATGSDTILSNRAPYAKYMLGTSRMMPRPITAAVAELSHEGILAAAHSEALAALETR